MSTRTLNRNQNKTEAAHEAAGTHFRGIHAGEPEWLQAAPRQARDVFARAGLDHARRRMEVHRSGSDGESGSCRWFPDRAEPDVDGVEPFLFDAETVAVWCL